MLLPMKTNPHPTFRLAAIATLLAAHPCASPLRATDETAPKAATETEVLAKAALSPTETVRVAIDYDSRDGDEEFAIFILRGGERKRLPAIPESLDATQKAQWVFARPSFQFSPDGKWLFGVQKICTGYCVGCLYEHAGGAAYKVATKTRFDAQAWRTFGKKEGAAVEELLASDSPPHLIDLIQVGNRYLAISLRGAILDLPKGKRVARDPENQKGETGIYDWRCLYDVKKHSFLITSGMEAHNKNAWKRWHGDAALWETDAAAAVKSAEKQLLTLLDKTAQGQFAQKKLAWESSLKAKQADESFSLFEALRARAAELEIRLCELQPE
jgi:hypothetical protein